MRVIGALLIIVAILALGFTAVSFQSQAVEGPAVDNGTNESAAAYNTTGGTMEIAGETLVNALLYGGLAAFTFFGIVIFAKGFGGR